MAETIACIRCGRGDAPALARVPLPGEAGRELAAKICASCWAEWQKTEVMVINELRLNFMDPSAQDILNQNMRQFLYLDGPPGEDGPSGTLPGMSPDSPIGEPSKD